MAQSFLRRADKEAVELSAIALQGLDQAQGQFNRASAQIATSFSTPSANTGGDIVDLSQAAVGLLSAKSDFDANLKVVRVGDEMERTTLALLG